MDRSTTAGKGTTVLMRCAVEAIEEQPQPAERLTTMWFVEGKRMGEKSSGDSVNDSEALKVGSSEIRSNCWVCSATGPGTLRNAWAWARNTLGRCDNGTR